MSITATAACWPAAAPDTRSIAREERADSRFENALSDEVSEAPSASGRGCQELANVGATGGEEACADANTDGDVGGTSRTAVCKDAREATRDICCRCGVGLASLALKAPKRPK